MSKQPKIYAPPQIYAHRGARMVAPENTLPAFEAALGMGVAGIELDVQCTKDGQLAVIHNFEVDETTSGSGRVGNFTAAELAQLDAGTYFDPQFSGVGVPILEEVLDLIGNRCQLNVEIKSEDDEGGDEAELLVALIQDRGLYEQVLVSSFNAISLIKMHWLDPNVPLALLYYKDLPPHLRQAWLSPILAPVALHPHHQLIDVAHMTWATSQNCAVNTWTVNDVAEAQRLAHLGVDVIMSDVPDEIMAALHNNS